MTTMQTPAKYARDDRAGPLERLTGALMLVAVLAPAGRMASQAAGNDAVWLGPLGLLAGLATAVMGCVLLYRAAATARTPWSRATVAVALGIAAMLVSFAYGAYLAGELRLDRFAITFLNVDLLRLVFPDLLRGAVNTIKLAMASTILAIVFGLLISTMVMSKRRWLRWPGVAYVDFVRSTPLVILTLLIVGGLPFIGVTLDFFVGVVVTLTVNASAYIAEIFRAGIQSLPRGQTDAALGLGMPSSTAFLYVVLPQAVRNVIPPLLNEFIALLKDTAIVAAVSGFTLDQRELYGAAKSAVSATFNPSPYMAAALLYLILVVPLTRLVGVLERRLRTGLA